MTAYHPERHYDGVAEKIRTRSQPSRIAGDDTPYFRYKRAKFLRYFLDGLDFDSREVLEVGCGPGGNLLHIAGRFSPRRLYGADISQVMLDLAVRTLADHDDLVELRKTDGVTLPFHDRSIDNSFTVTVLQHNPDDRMFHGLIGEMCRVTRETIILMEDTGKPRRRSDFFLARPRDVYRSALERHGYCLVDLKFLNTRVSRLWSSAVTRALAPADRRDGEPIGALATTLIGGALPLTRALDDVFRERRNLTRMVFQRAGS